MNETSATDVTVLTCVYNGMPHLKEAVESVLSQTHGDFHYLIIDDCSTDERVQDYLLSLSDNRITLVRNSTNLGVCNTFNKALSLIDTQFVIRIDQDDVCLPHRVEKQLAFLQDNPSVDVVCSWETTIDQDGNRIRDWCREITDYGDFLAYVLLGLCPIWHPSLAFNQEKIKHIGGFDKRYTRAEDFEFTTKVALNRLNAAIVPEILLEQRQHPNSQSREYEEEQKEVSQRIHREALQYFISHEDLEPLLSYLTLSDMPHGVVFNRHVFRNISERLNELFESVVRKQAMNVGEIKSFRKRFNRRIGYASDNYKLICVFPEPLFRILHFLLSPMQFTPLKALVSKGVQQFYALRSPIAR